MTTLMLDLKDANLVIPSFNSINLPILLTTRFSKANTISSRPPPTSFHHHGCPMITLQRRCSHVFSDHVDMILKRGVLLQWKLFTWSLIWSNHPWPVTWPHFKTLFWVMNLIILQSLTWNTIKVSLVCSTQHYQWYLLSEIFIILIQTLPLLFGFIISDSVVCSTILWAKITVEHPSVELVL
jgi:hypothetical protein